MTAPFSESLHDLPGADLVAKGIEDLAEGVISAEALLLIIAAPELERLGIELPPWDSLDTEAELALYQRLCEEGRQDPYSAYNALLRTIVSFTRSLGHRLQNQRRRAAAGGGITG